MAIVIPRGGEQLGSSSEGDSSSSSLVHQGPGGTVLSCGINVIVPPAVQRVLSFPYAMYAAVCERGGGGGACVTVSWFDDAHRSAGDWGEL